jgi:uncharacterized protein (TIGR02147 family)
MIVFEHNDYKDVLNFQIAENRERRGYRSELSEAAGCQLSYLSQVLHSHVHLTPDHAAGLADFWGLDSDERDYFMELVNIARAGSQKLKAILLKRLAEIRERHENLAKRYKKKNAVSPEDQAVYYSSWHLSAIHILLTIPEFRTAPQIAKRVGLPLPMVLESLEQLAKIGLAIKKESIWHPGHSDIHLAKDSVLTAMNHSNWRSRALLDAYKRDSGGIHYTAVHSLGRTDFEKLKDMVLRFIDQTRAVVRPSAEEELACMTLDWFVV